MNLTCLDDDPSMEPALRRFAARLGHAVRFHSAVARFKADVETSPPDLIVLALELGQENGIDVIHWLAGCAARPPLILISGQGDDLLDSARRIARARGIEVLGAVSKGRIVHDLPPLLGPAGPARPPRGRTAEPAPGAPATGIQPDTGCRGHA